MYTKHALPIFFNAIVSYQQEGSYENNLECFISAISLSQMSWNGSEQLERAMEEVLDDVGDGPKAAEEKESPIALGSQNRPPSLTLDTAPNGTSCSQYTCMHTHTNYFCYIYRYFRRYL